MARSCVPGTDVAVMLGLAYVLAAVGLVQISGIAAGELTALARRMAAGPPWSPSSGPCSGSATANRSRGRV